MKFEIAKECAEYETSLPVRGAWVEICQGAVQKNKAPSLPVRGAWVEICKDWICCCKRWSLPVRGAWVEMSARFSRCRN